MADDNMNLKPCPFCGGPAELVKCRRPDGKTTYKVGYVRCKKCYARSGEQSLDGYYGAPIATDQELRELWNKRYEPATDSKEPTKQLCQAWNPGHHVLNQRCELTGEYRVCNCNGDHDKCDYAIRRGQPHGRK